MSNEALVARVRGSLGVFVEGVREPLRVVGKDRARFLQGMLSNDVAKLGVGQGCHAVWLTAKGKVLADLGVVADADAIWLLCPPGRRGAVMAGLDRFVIADDVRFEVPEGTPVGVVGPGAAAALGVDLAPWALGEARVAGAELRAFGWRETGLPGVLLLAPAAAGDVAAELTAGQGATPPEVAEVLRVEAGVPRFGAEFDEETLVLEAGLDDCVSYTKGCYVGQETVARQHTRGHVNRGLRGLLLAGEAVPERGDRVSAPGRDDGGVVTSAVYSPTLRRPIAIASLHRSLLQGCPRVTVRRGDASLEAEVVELPFVPRA
jgi:folate-binding protein YgfZ